MITNKSTLQFSSNCNSRNALKQMYISILADRVLNSFVRSANNNCISRQTESASAFLFPHNNLRGNPMTTLNSLEQFRLISQSVIVYYRIILLFSNISDNRFHNTFLQAIDVSSIITNVRYIHRNACR